MNRLPTLWNDFDRSFGNWRPLLRQMDEMFNDFALSSNRDFGRIFTPACDVEETDDHYVLSFDVPGISKDDLNIELEGNLLTVSGERKAETEGRQGRFIERRYGRFERSMTLPQGVKPDQVEAQYKDGVLTVVVPKSAEARRTRIKIGEGKSGFFKSLLSGNGKKRQERGEEQGSVSMREESGESGRFVPTH